MAELLTTKLDSGCATCMNKSTSASLDAIVVGAGIVVVSGDSDDDSEGDVCAHAVVKEEEEEENELLLQSSVSCAYSFAGGGKYESTLVGEVCLVRLGGLVVHADVYAYVCPWRRSETLEALQRSSLSMATRAAALVAVISSLSLSSEWLEVAGSDARSVALVRLDDVDCASPLKVNISCNSVSSWWTHGSVALLSASEGVVS